MTILISAFFGNLTLLFLDSLTILFRTLSASIWPAIYQIITAAETALYQVHFLSEPISIFDTWIRPSLLPSEPVFYRAAWIYAGFFLGIIGLNLIAQRFWCRYICPLGGLLGLISKIALFRREPGEACRECSICQKNCPTGTIDQNRGYRSDPAECTMCLECLETCPGSTIVFTPHFKPETWHPYDPKKREALASLGLSILAIGVIRSDLIAKRDTPFLLRPPGARENNLLSKCIRCSECIRACPTSALQPAVSESGLEGLWTPVMIPRSGYCDYSCNTCGQVCPVEAIPSLSLEEKRQQTIGRAYIDQNRCIAWADHTGCIVCEEMCPLPEKAIQLDITDLTNPDGSITQLQLPRVLRDRCIGCGICEYKCPVNGTAAIRVYVPQTEVFF